MNAVDNLGSSIKNSMRKALREMLMCSALLVPILLFLDGSLAQPGTYWVAAVLALALCPIAWGLYRIGRFVLNR